jgi:hypothetical protein
MMLCIPYCVNHMAIYILRICEMSGRYHSPEIQVLRETCYELHEYAIIYVLTWQAALDNALNHK